MSVHLALVKAAAPAADPRPALLRQCAGEPLRLRDDELDLVALVNGAATMTEPLLDPDTDPDDYRVAAILIEYLVRHFGVDRHGKGDRLQGVESVYRRYLLPFLIELDHTRPAGRRGVADLRLSHLEQLPRILSGDLPLPAATVAGDLLRRRGAACIYLTREEAAAVADGGAKRLMAAIGDGQVTLEVDVRTGEPIIRTSDLRRAGLLLERTTPHGLARSTARNVLRDLALVLERARAHGANVRGRFDLEPIEPLPQNRLREPKADAAYVELATIAEVGAHLPVVGQLVLWIARLVGERIGEVYGLNVADYSRDELGRGWLSITKQGGIRSLGRDPHTGRLFPQDSKPHTKSEAGTRFIPIPRQLADLLDHVIDAFHTDPETGQVAWTNRLVPGIGKDDASGQSSFRSWLDAAQEIVGTDFDPHHCRASLITYLKNHGVEERLAFHYAGHEHPDATIQDKHYDLGPGSELLVPIAELLEEQIAEETPTADLRIPTARRETWGTGTRWYARRHAIEKALVEQGWRLPGEYRPGQGHQLTVAQVAAAIGKAESYTRRLLSNGTIPAHQIPWGTRHVWAAWEVDVYQYLRATTGTAVADLAAETGWEYVQVWHVLRTLGLIPTGHVSGRAIRLTDDQANQFRAEVAIRRDTERDAVSLSDAADALDLPLTAVETLVRENHLELTAGPTDARRRYVTRSSVEAYRETYPAHPVAGDGAGLDVLLTGSDTRRILGIRRSELTLLTTTRQLATGTKPRSRHVYYSAQSALRWAQRTSRLAAVEKLTGALAGAAQPTID